MGAGKLYMHPFCRFFFHWAGWPVSWPTSSLGLVARIFVSLTVTHWIEILKRSLVTALAVGDKQWIAVWITWAFTAMVPVGDQLQLVVSVTEVLTRPCARCTAFNCIPHLQIVGIVAKVDVARQILPIRCELQQEFFPFFGLFRRVIYYIMYARFRLVFEKAVDPRPVDIVVIGNWIHYIYRGPCRSTRQDFTYSMRWPIR